MFFTKSTNIICVSCSLECTVSYPTNFQKLRRKVKYCPHCGESIDNTLPEDSILEEDKEEKTN